MDEKQLQFLFDNYAKGKGFADYGEFKSLMEDSASRKVFFEDSNKELGFADYNDFENTIGVKKKVTSNVAPTASGNGLSSTPKAKDPLQEALDARSRQRKEGAVGNISMPRNASDATATNLQQKTEMIDDNVLNRQSEASLKKENEEFKQQALETTAKRSKRTKEEVKKDVDEGKLILSSDGKGNKIYARQPGAGETFIRGLSSSINSLADAGTIAAVKATGSPEELAALYEMIALRKKQEAEKEFSLEDITNPLKSLPSNEVITDLPTAAPGVVGTLTEMGGALAPDIAMAMGTGGLSTAAKTSIIGSKMYASSYGNKAYELYEQGKQELMKSGMDESQASVLAAKAATENAATAAIPDAAMNTLFFSGKLHSPAANNFISVMKGAAKDAVRVGGLGAATSGITSAIESNQGYDIGNIIDKMVESGGEFAKLDLLFKVLPILRTLPKAAQSAVKEFAVDPVVNPVVESYLKSVPEDIANRIRVELQDYKSATEPVRGVVPEEKMASLGGRMQKRQNRINGINIIKGDIEALEAKKKDLPETLHEEINTTIKEREGQIKELEKEIESVDKEIGEINKSKETGLEKEIDEATGEPLIPKGEPEQISQPIELSTEVGELKPGEPAPQEAKPTVSKDKKADIERRRQEEIDNLFSQTQASTDKQLNTPVQKLSKEEINRNIETAKQQNKDLIEELEKEFKENTDNKASDEVWDKWDKKSDKLDNNLPQGVSFRIIDGKVDLFDNQSYRESNFGGNSITHVSVTSLHRQTEKFEVGDRIQVQDGARALPAEVTKVNENGKILEAKTDDGRTIISKGNIVTTAPINDRLKINAKYDAEIAALPKQEAKPTVSSEGSVAGKDVKLKKQVNDAKDEDGFIRDIITDFDVRYKNRKDADFLTEIEPTSVVYANKPKQDIDNTVVKSWEERIDKGERPPIIIRENGEIDGQHKLEAYKNLQFDEVPVIYEKDLRKFYKDNKGQFLKEQPSTPVSEGKTKVENEAATQKPIEPVEPIKAEEVITPKETVIEVSEGGGEPPKGETVSSGIYSEPKRTEFSHRGLQEVATEFGLDPVTSRERKSDAELFRRVDETLSEWTKSGEYNKNIEELLQRDRVKKPISDEENVIIAQHIAQLRKQGGDIRKEAGINSPEYNEKLKELNEVVRVGEAIRSEQGAALRVPIFSREYMPTLEDAMTAKMDAVGTDVLTPKQKVEVEKQFEKIEKERDEYKAKLEAANAKFAEMQAQNELSKPASKGKTTTGKRDYKAERQSLKDRLKEEVAAYKAAGQKMGIASDGGAESFVVSAKIAKTITEIAKTHVAEAGAKIKEVVEKTLEDVREYFGDKITDRDIMDVLAGKYNEKRKTRSQLAADMREVQTEAKLLNEYQRLLEGGEPKNEKRQIQRNKRLAEIRKELKGLEELDKEIQTSKDAELQVRIDKNKETVDKLDKLEKEDARAAEKKRKEIEAENLKELAKLKEEFDKKVRENERKKKEDEIALNKKLKEQADEKQRQMDKEAREYEQKLREEEIQRKKDEIALVKELDRKLKYKSPAERMAAKAIERNKAREKKIRDKITNKDYEPNPKPETFWEDPSFKKNHPDLYKKVLDSQIKMEETQLEYEKELIADEMARAGWTEKGQEIWRKTAGTVKHLFASFDFSGLAVQNLPMIMTNPLIGAKGIKMSAKDFASQRRFDRYIAELHNSADWKLMKDSGLRVSEPKSLLEEGRDQMFPDRFKAIVKIKGKTYGYMKVGDGKYELLDISKPFERQFVSLGNTLRVIKFRTEANKLIEDGYTFEKNPQEFEGLAKRINNLTSGGDVPQSFQNPLTNTFIWSTRLMAAKLNMLGISDLVALTPLGKAFGIKKGYYQSLGVKGQKLSRQQIYAAADLAKFASTVMATTYLSAMAGGGKVNTDPLDDRFLDVTFKDGISKNYTGGFSKYISFVFQLIRQGKSKDGKFTPYSGIKDRGQQVTHFLAGKAPPITRAVEAVAIGKDYTGKEATVGTEASKFMYPMAIGQIVEQIKKDGMEGLFEQGIETIIGVGVKDERDYEKKDEGNQGMPPKGSKAIPGMPQKKEKKKFAQ